MNSNNNLILDKGKRVPLTAAWLKEKVQAHQRIDLIIAYASLSHEKMVKVIPLVDRTHMRENKVLELFSPYLNPKPVIPNRLQEIRQALRQTIGRIHWRNSHRTIQPLCKATVPPNYGQFSTH